MSNQAAADGVEPAELLTIGAFARLCGLTAGALRFYDDVGLLPPARVDPSSGYRYYAAQQQQRARTIRRLRELEVSLGGIEQYLDASAGDRRRLLDQHTADLRARAERARQLADALIDDRADPVGNGILSGPILAGPILSGPILPGPIWASALERVATAAADPVAVSGELRLLAGVRVEVDAGAVTITATDRYRLTTRTLVVGGTADGWARTIDTEALGRLVPSLRRRGTVRAEPLGDGIRFVDADPGDERNRADLPCAGLSGLYPDHRAMLAGLPEPVTRVIVDRRGLLDRVESALEAPGSDGRSVRMRARAGELQLGAGTIPARITGADATVIVDPVTLHPALEAAVGADLALDIIAADQPIRVRSADPGDVLSLVMPVAA